MHPGTQQDERLAAPLDPARSSPFLRPDELALATRLRLTLELARQLRFVDDMALHQGHWGHVLEQDLSFVLADISSTPTAEQEDRVMALWPRMSDRQQWHYCLRLAKRLDTWCAQLEQHAAEAGGQSDANALAMGPRMLRQLQAQLDDELGRLLRQLKNVYVQDDDSGLATLLARIGKDQAPLPAAAQPRALRQLWLSLCRAQRQLALLASEVLPDSLLLGDHDPAMGALLSLVQLVQMSRAPLDDFTNRLIQYYYRDRLGFTQNMATGDRVHLLLERDPRYAKPVLLPLGADFIGGKNARGQPLHFRSEQELLLTTLKVESLLALRLDSDPRISPEHELAYATQARSLKLCPPTPEQAALPRARAWPLLGGGSSIDFEEAQQGMALASPLLYLREGDREIEIELQLSHPTAQDNQLQRALDEQDHIATFKRLAMYESMQPPPDNAQIEQLLGWLPHPDGSLPATGAWLRFLLALCLATQRPDLLRARLGRLFAVWISSSEDLDEPDLAALRSHAQQVLGYNRANEVQVDNPLSLIYGTKPLERSLIFDRVFRGLWRAQLSTAAGWFTPGEVYVSRIEPSSLAAGARLQLRLKLSASAPAIQACTVPVHGAEWPALPVLQMRMSSQTRVFGCSLLQHLALDAVRLQVRASGMRQLLLYNQLGRLDASKPFLPFGPLPDRSAYLMFSNAELASKPLSELSLQLQWAGLPSTGLAKHYAVYADDADDAQRLAGEAPDPRRWDESSFAVRPALLHAARWQDCSTTLPLFAAQGPQQTLQFASDDLRRLHQPTREEGNLAGTPLVYTLSSRQGYFRLQLDGPQSAFGHFVYPRLLSDRLTRNSRNKRSQDKLPLPAEPYTPRLEQMSFSYTAQERITAAHGPSSPTLPCASQLMQIGPFGVQALQRSGSDGRHHLLAPWPCGADLFIGLSGTASAGKLSLLFQLQAEAAAEALGRPRPALKWAAWCGSRWRDLEPHRLLMDGTQGLLRTGIMLLDLPEGMTAGCPELRAAQPRPLQWLRVSAVGDLTRLAPIQGVWAQAVSARRWQEPTRQERDDVLLPVPVNSIQAVQPVIAGLANIRQPLPSFGLRQKEDEASMRTRVAERLRHRDRALTPWDMERLVLQAFPQVQKVKCLPLGAEGRSSQRVLLVVVPALAPGREIEGTEAPRLDAATLDVIAASLLQRGVPHLRLLVRNAVYDRIQVRCKLKLKAGFQSGERLRQLNQALNDYLSPWRPGGLTARFDWTLRADEMEAFLRAQAGVDSVGEVSLLHIVRSDRQRNLLNDSARTKALNVITPSQPWSLALPVRKHLLELSDTTPPSSPRTTGLARLALGSSFIIGGARA